MYVYTYIYIYKQFVNNMADVKAVPNLAIIFQFVSLLLFLSTKSQLELKCCFKGELQRLNYY